LRIHFPPAPRDEPRPGDGETKGIVADLLHQSDIFPVAVIEIGGRAWTHLIVKAMGFDLVPMVPDGFPLSPFPGRSLDLGRRCGASPPKALWKTIFYGHAFPPERLLR